MATKRDEILWKRRKERIQFWLAISVIVFMLALYFVVAPVVLAFTGRRLELPDVKIVFTFLIALAAPAISINPGKFKAVMQTVLDKIPEEADDAA